MSAQDRQVEQVIRARDAGRSWTQVADMLGVTVADAKTLVADEQLCRRQAMARTPLNEAQRGLLDDCRHCHHPRKVHRPDDGTTDISCTVCGPEHTVYEIVDNRVDPPALSTADERPERPAGPRFDDWYFHSQQVGCEGFQTTAEHQAILDDCHTGRLGNGARRTRFPNDVRLDAYDLGVLNTGGWQAYPNRALQSRRGGPKLTTLVRRARRKLAKKTERESAAQNKVAASAVTDREPRSS